MTTVELPGLDGRQPLGFLAALGLLRVLVQERHLPARLSFSATTALLHSPLTSTREIADTLGEVVSEIEAPAVLPGVGAGFPPAGEDPLRWPREQYREHAAALRATHPRAARLWLPCLTTDLAVDSQGRGALSPFLTLYGRQDERGFFEKPLQAVRTDPAHLLWQAIGEPHALRRTAAEGEPHALPRTADHPHGGTDQEHGVPGATWLATMALPLFRLTGDGTSLRCTLWHQVAGDHLMIWPLWHPALDLDAVRCLLEHPTFRPIDEAPTVSTAAWEALGVIAAHGAWITAVGESRSRARLTGWGPIRIYRPSC